MECSSSSSMSAGRRNSGSGEEDSVCWICKYGFLSWGLACGLGMGGRPQHNLRCLMTNVELNQLSWLITAGLEGPSTSNPLERPCACPRDVHLRCLGRWCLQQAGRRCEQLHSSLFTPTLQCGVLGPLTSAMLRAELCGAGRLERTQWLWVCNHTAFWAALYLVCKNGVLQV